MSKIKSKGWAWVKFINGVVGISATVIWFVFMVGSPVVITLAGVPVAGSAVFSMILIGNAYGLFCLAKEGHATLEEYREIKRMHTRHAAYQRVMRTRDDESDV